MRYCEHCGNGIKNENAKFCSKCGAKIPAALLNPEEDFPARSKNRLEDSDNERRKVISIDEIRLRISKLSLSELLVYGARAAILYLCFLFVSSLTIKGHLLLFCFFSLPFAIFLWLFALRKTSVPVLHIGKWICATGFTVSVFFNIAISTGLSSLYYNYIRGASVVNLLLGLIFPIGLIMVGCSFSRHPQMKVSKAGVKTAVAGIAMIVYPILLNVLTPFIYNRFGTDVGFRLHSLINSLLRIVCFIPFIMLLLRVSGGCLIPFKGKDKYPIL